MDEDTVFPSAWSRYAEDPLSCSAEEVIHLARELLHQRDLLTEENAWRLLLHAIALEGDPNGRLSELLASLTTPDRWTRWSPEPESGKLIWTLGAVLRGKELASPDCPRVTAWFVQDENDRIQEVLILGRGTRRLQQELTQVALGAALSLPRDTPALLLNGLIWLTASSLGEAAGGDLLDWPDEIAEEAADVLTVLEIDLRALAEQTALLRVVRVSHREQGELVRERLAELRHRVQATRQPEVLRGPAGESAIAAMLPVRKLAGSGPRLTIPIADEILQTQAFRRLYDQIIQFLLDRLYAHARLRLDFYRQHLRHHEGQREYYDRLDASERANVDRQRIEIGSIIDFELCTVVTLVVPNFTTGREYYTENLPRLIAQDVLWVKRMQRILDAVERNRGVRQTATWRLIAARILDMVIRETEPPDPDLVEPFRKLRAILRPYLIDRIEDECRAQKIDSLCLRGRRLVFGLATGRQNHQLVPWWVWSTASGGVEASVQGNLLRVIDLVDSVSTVPLAGTTEERDVRSELEALRGERDIDRIREQVIGLAEVRPGEVLLELTSWLCPQAPEVVPEVRQLSFIELELLADSWYLLRAGALGPALRLLSDLLDELRKAHRDPLPDTLLQVLLFAAFAAAQTSKRQQDSPWEILQRWAKDGIGREERALADLVTRSLALLRKLDPEYLDRCTRSRQVLPSEAVLQRRDKQKQDSQGYLATLWHRAARAVRACLRLKEWNPDTAGPLTGRSIYKEIAPHLLQATLLGLGESYEDQIEKLFDKLLWAEHILRPRREADDKS